MMKLNYNFKLRLIACALLLNLFLQSCSGFSNQFTGGISETTNEVPRVTKHIDTRQLVGQELTAEEGHIVTFYEQGSKLQADVEMNVPEGFSKTYRALPVYIDKALEVSQIPHLNKERQQRIIHFNSPQNGQPTSVTLFKKGLLGGMMEGDEEPNQNKKEGKSQNIKLIVDSSSKGNFDYVRLNMDAAIPVIPREEIEINYEKRLGAGGQGFVFQATYQEKTAAVKLLAGSPNEEAVAAFQQEAIIMANHHHNNIVDFLGFCPGHNILVMEYVSGGSLWDLLSSSKDISWQHRYQIALDVAEGISYLHDHGILHRDLKSQNILLDNSRRAKVTDFGISLLKSERSTFGPWDGCSGTIRWMAPEIFHTSINSQAGDVYSYGMVLWQLGARKEPFAAVKGLFQVLEHIKAGNREVISNDTPSEIREVIELCWLPEPPFKKEMANEQRPPMEEIRHMLEKLDPAFKKYHELNYFFQAQEKEQEGSKELAKVSPVIPKIAEKDQEKEHEKEKENATESTIKEEIREKEKEKEKEDKEINYSSLLHDLTITGELEITKRSIAQGADVNVVESQQLEAAKFCLSPGSTLEEFDKGFSIIEDLVQRGYSEAQYTLGYLYYKPEVDIYQYLAQSNRIRPDTNEAGRLDIAAHWYKLAAEQRHKNAARTLGRLYRDNKVRVPIPPGQPQDGRYQIVEALKYYYIARDAGSTTIDSNIQELEKQLQRITKRI